MSKRGWGQHEQNAEVKEWLELKTEKSAPLNIYIVPQRKNKELRLRKVWVYK
jgi:hypothetical protein